MRICILTDEEVKDFDPAPYMQGFDWEMVTMTDPVLMFCVNWTRATNSMFI